MPAPPHLFCPWYRCIIQRVSYQRKERGLSKKGSRNFNNDQKFKPLREYTLSIEFYLNPPPIGLGAVPSLVFLPFTQNILRQPIPENSWPYCCECPYGCNIQHYKPLCKGVSLSEAICLITLGLPGTSRYLIHIWDIYKYKYVYFPKRCNLQLMDILSLLHIESLYMYGLLWN